MASADGRGLMAPRPTACDQLAGEKPNCSTHSRMVWPMS